MEDNKTNILIMTISVILVIVYIAMTIGSLFSFFSLIWLTTFGIGWGGGETSLIELIWMWKGFLLLSVASLFAAIGLIKSRKIGIYFGYTLTFGFLAYVIFYNVSYFLSPYLKTELFDFILFVINLSILTLLFLGQRMIQKTIIRLKIKDIILIGLLSIILLLSFYPIIN